ncbi:MAG: virulence protein RhuM/Fic/DOC family protein [Pseudomonadota bacterium]
MRKTADRKNHGEIVIYKSGKNNVVLEAYLQKESVWLSLDQMARLFGRDNSVISRHIKNVFEEKELGPKSVVAKFATTASDGKTYQVDYYNLDVIISVGYRVKSHSGVRFRIWATKVLKNHLIKGYTLNKKRLNELKGDELKTFEDAITFMRQTIASRSLSSKEESGLLQVITEYAYTWILLQKYDKDELSPPKAMQLSAYALDYPAACEAINQLKSDLVAKKEASDLFGWERGSGLEGILRGIYQTFGGDELYPTIEEKAAHLLYFIIKDHPFADGNKRIGSLLFILFLSRNKYLLRKNGEKKINDNALVAIALLVAESKPKQKDVMIRLIMHFLAGRAGVR